MRTGSLNVRRRRRAKVAVFTAGLALGACLFSSLTLPVRAADPGAAGYDDVISQAGAAPGAARPSSLPLPAQAPATPG